MAKVLPFKVEIKIDGKEILVEAGRDVRELPIYRARKD